MHSVQLVSRVICNDLPKGFDADHTILEHYAEGAIQFELQDPAERGQVSSK